MARSRVAWCPGRTHGTERGAAFAAHHQVGAEHDRAGGVARGFERIGIERGIRIEIVNAGFGARRFDLVDVAAGVNALELLARRRRRGVVRYESVESRADEMVVDGVQALRTFGMVRAHVVQVTRGMRDVRDRHGNPELSSEMSLKCGSSRSSPK